MIPDPQVLVGGVFLGALYGLSAMGFQLIMGTTGQVYLAYGHMWVAAALAVPGLLAMGFLPLPLVLVLLAAAGWAIGWWGHPGALWRGKGPSHGRRFFLITLGLALIVEDVGARLWPLPSTAFTWAPPPVEWGSVTIPPVKALVLLLVATTAALLHAGLHRSRWGRALRAWDRGAGPIWVAGVDPRRLGRLSLGTGLAVAGAAGFFLSLSYTAAIQEGLAMTMRCLVVAVLAGRLSPWRVLAAGLGLGLGEALTAHWLGSQWAPLLGYLLLLALGPLRRQPS